MRESDCELPVARRAMTVKMGISLRRSESCALLELVLVAVLVQHLLEIEFLLLHLFA